MDFTEYARQRHSHLTNLRSRDMELREIQHERQIDDYIENVF